MPKVRRTGAAFPVFFLFLFIVFMVAGSAAQARSTVSPSFQGFVKDTLGRALDEVEVLVLGAAAGDPPLAVARTDPEGRFLVPDLAPGIYRVAAVKQGYLAFLGRFNTLLRNSYDLVLRPFPGGEPGGIAAPADAAWALRLPARSLLRETEASDLRNREGIGGSRLAGPTFGETIGGQVDHLVDMGVRLSDGSSGTEDSGGAETRIRLSSSLGQRGSVTVRGQRESFDRVTTSQGGPETASREASSVLVDACFATGSDSDFVMKASYDARHIDVNGGASLSEGSLRHTRRVLGYDATWSLQTDAASRLALRFGLLDALAVLPDGVAGSLIGEAGVDRGFSHQEAAVGGSYRSLEGDHHEIRVDLEAAFRDLPLPLARYGADDLTSTAAEAAQWNVRLRAEDRLSISTPLTLMYGFGYEHGSGGREPSVIEPRIGAEWTDGTCRTGLTVLYDLPAVGGGASGSDLASANVARRSRGFGYEAEFEVPLVLGLRLTGTQSYEPASYDTAGALWDRIDPSFTPLYVTGGSTSAERSSLLLSWEAGGVRTYLQLQRGEVYGSLSQAFPFEVPLQLLADRRLRYYGGRVGLRLASSGTDASAEYRKVEDVPDGESVVDGTTQEFVELQLAQALLRHGSRGMSWRFLLAARGSPRRESADSDSSAAAGSRTLAALSRRVSAGISVAF